MWRSGGYTLIPGEDAAHHDVRSSRELLWSSPSLDLRSGGVSSVAAGAKCSCELVGDNESGGLSASRATVSFMPILGADMVMDDHNATIVLIFPTEIAAKKVLDPATCCRALFPPSGHHDDRYLDAVLEKLGRDELPIERYQQVIRSHACDVLRRNGIRIATFRSIDDDEVFMKLSVPREGTVIQQMAERYGYNMPFQKFVYSSSELQEPPSNDAGTVVVASRAFRADIADRFSPFRNVDEVRLLMHSLDRCFNLEEMKAQSVIRGHFVAAKHDAVQELHEIWASLCHIVCLPHSGGRGTIRKIRDYFGEEIGFFFRWHSFYTRSLLSVALVGLLGSLLRRTVMQGHEGWLSALHYCLACVALLWAALFNQLFEEKAARDRQEWGMDDLHGFVQACPSYDPDAREWLRYLFVRLVVIGFCCLFGCTIFIIQGLQELERKHHRKEGFFNSNGQLVLVVIIKLAAFLWGKMAAVLVSFANPRTQRRKNDLLVKLLAAVKLFVALWPFLQLAFVRPFSTFTCAADLETVAKVSWKSNDNSSWPTDALDNFKRYTFIQPDGDTCVHTCFPASPFDAKPWSHTNCYQELVDNIMTFYVFQCMTSLVFLIIPILLTRWQVHQELNKAAKASGAGGTSSYSLLQFQAKCLEAAPYEYYSWGGSWVEDFLDVITGFALLICFGLVCPLIAVLAFVGNMVQHRLLAYRMVHVTCRPYPAVAAGIGPWSGVLEVICNLAIVTNAAMVSFILYPMNVRPFRDQLLLFVLIENGLLFVRTLFRMLLNEEPADVMRISDFNSMFKQRALRYPALKVPTEEAPATVFSEGEADPSQLKLRPPVDDSCSLCA